MFDIASLAETSWFLIRYGFLVSTSFSKPHLASKGILKQGRANGLKFMPDWLMFVFVSFLFFKKKLIPPYAFKLLLGRLELSLQTLKTHVLVGSFAPLLNIYNVEC